MVPDRWHLLHTSVEPVPKVVEPATKLVEPVPSHVLLVT